MKRFVLVLAALGAFGLVLSGCNKEDKSKEEPAAAKPADGDKAAQPAPDEAKKEEATDDTAGDEAAPADEAGDSAAIGIEECDALVKRYMECEGIPPQAKEAFKKGAEAWKQSAAAEGGQDATKKACETAAQNQDEVLKKAGC